MIGFKPFFLKNILCGCAYIYVLRMIRHIKTYNLEIEVLEEKLEV